MKMSSWFRKVGLAVVAVATISCGYDLGAPKPDAGPPDAAKAGDGGVAGEVGSKSEVGTAEVGAKPDAIEDTAAILPDAPVVFDAPKADAGTDSSIHVADAPEDVPVDGKADSGDTRSVDGSAGN